MAAAIGGAPHAPTGLFLTTLAAAAEAKPQPEPLLGEWTVYPAIGPTTRSCTITVLKDPFGPKKGRARTFACNLAEGLGGINGVSIISGWKREGGRIVLSAIARPKEVNGTVTGDHRSVMKR
ncbi:hypothetical protein [Acuticoccus kandeliae]|uniref:hypothetical protein n=1 Tax=Acuticoccus kandeliae TaxID=2073160 RepID=UPI000D3ED453|nr:hypothetical protein [Acuticoccus kandeliae]